MLWSCASEPVGMVSLLTAGVGIVMDLSLIGFQSYVFWGLVSSAGLKSCGIHCEVTPQGEAQVVISLLNGGRLYGEIVYQHLQLASVYVYFWFA